MSYSQIGITIRDWIEYKKRVGVEMLHITGLPGWGKTNLANSLVLKCAKQGESWVLPGDRFCEWRHFLLYPSILNEVTVIIPENVEINYYGQKFNEVKDIFIEQNYNELEIMDFLPDDGKTRLVAIYDAHLAINERAWLWYKITDQLLNRGTHLRKAIGILFNEAGVYFPEHCEGDQWKAVQEYAKIIVDCRKGLVRLVFVSQMPNEIKSTIRNKCNFKIRRKGTTSKTDHSSLKKSTPFLARNQYNLSIGGLFVKNNLADLFIEENEIMKMIPPRGSIDIGGGGDVVDVVVADVKKTSKKEITCQICNYIWFPRTERPKRCPKCGQWLDYGLIQEVSA